ncbi:MAG: glycosyltransferase family 4 protein [Akkermansiaceae bacterium]|jgi:glycosyltransferase involved in cell wall biosynthesis|nr:glycosyltransferase family 4 protein [Akkermansiaceae bacterium]MDP4721664.1 glycosyltransferase family 4 protein [Akkermansiaceae bacterium]MDP4778836.1 glycosyltransferase family 4 protein [Akkermansiaceae bacterium]MDP4846963.1 glycosyltransferase family 4 protein [Akkermansiaceae bacterium]
MIKICIFAEFPLSAISGEVSGRGGGQAATWLPQLAKAWEQVTDCEIHWAIFDRTAKTEDTQYCWNQTFHQIPCPGISASMLLGRLPHRKAAQRLLNRLKPDLIHCWGTENLNGSALLEFDGPSILSMQGVITTYFKTGDLKGWRWNLFRHWEPVSLRKASVVTSESQWGLNQVKSIVSGKNLHKVEYGVHLSYYSVPWQPKASQPRILFVGGLNRLKGVDILLQMLKKHPNRPWKMVFAGGGYLADALRALNDPSIEVLGMLKTEQVQAEMSKAWALVMPSRADTSPNVVKEARVIGLPVIGSPNGGHAEYIEHGKDGLIVVSENTEDWFKALDSLCRDFDTCRAMGVVRHQWFRHQFRPEKTAEGFLELYRRMMD